MTPGLGLDTSSYEPDNLIAGEYPRATRANITITGGAALLRGALLGRVITPGAVTFAIDAGNTGNGVLSAQAAAAGCQIGAYRVVCIEPGANVGTFAVFDPQGVEIGRFIVGGAAFNNQITFTIADGAADFVAGDAFTINVAAGAEKYKLSAAAAVDGSQIPVAVLAKDADASAGDVAGDIYLTGEFNKLAITFGVGHTAVSTLWDLAQKNIYLRDSVSN
jgi:hypothetical protein